MKMVLFFATGFYSGYLPGAPGTWGSLVTIPLFLLLAGLSLRAYLLFLALFIVAAIILAGSAEKILDRKDPQVVVIDEMAGMLVTLAGCGTHWSTIAAGFCLFRFFDILKPYPIRQADRRINGGIGIVLDDLLAGLFSLGCLQAGKVIVRLLM